MCYNPRTGQPLLNMTNMVHVRQMATHNPVLIPVEGRQLVNGRQFLVALSNGLGLSLDLDLETRTPANRSNPGELPQRLSSGARGERTPTRPGGRSTPTCSSPGGRVGARRITTSTMSRSAYDETMDDSEFARVKQEPVDAPRAWVKQEPRTAGEIPEVIPVSSDDNSDQDVSRGATAKSKGRNKRHSSSDSTESYEWDWSSDGRKITKSSRGKRM